MSQQSFLHSRSFFPLESIIASFKIWHSLYILLLRLSGHSSTAIVSKKICSTSFLRAIPPGVWISSSPSCCCLFWFGYCWAWLLDGAVWGPSLPRSSQVALCSPLDWILASWTWLTSSIFLIYSPLSGGPYPPVNPENGYMREKVLDSSCLITFLVYPYLWLIVGQIMHPKLKIAFTEFWKHFNRWFLVSRITVEKFNAIFIPDPSQEHASPPFFFFSFPDILGFFSLFLVFWNGIRIGLNYAGDLIFFSPLFSVISFWHFYPIRGRTWSSNNLYFTIVHVLTFFFSLLFTTVPQLYVPILLFDFLHNLRFLFYNCIWFLVPG